MMAGLLAGALLLASCGNERVAMPGAASIGQIDVCVGRKSCEAGKYRITERPAIAAVAAAARAYGTGWHTELEMALTTGRFTYPTPQDSVSIKGRDGNTLLVLWFGPGWMGCAVEDSGERKRYFRKVKENDVSELKAALRIPDRSNKPGHR
jgi:hypothetical protein